MAIDQAKPMAMVYPASIYPECIVSGIILKYHVCKPNRLLLLFNGHPEVMEGISWLHRNTLCHAWMLSPGDQVRLSTPDFSETR